MKTKILITGGTGLVGSRLSDRLTEKGYEVWHLSRKENLEAKYPAYRWDVTAGFIDERALKADHIIHLAGESVASGRWTASRKKKIYDSRIESTNLIARHINEGKLQVKSFIAASAIGIYGSFAGSEVKSEESQSADDFLAQVVKDWEKAADNVTKIPVAKIRIGVVLSDMEGALPKLLQPIKLGVGAPLGTGKQYMSWIHIDDLVGIFIHALENRLTGVYNAVAPSPETNADFTRQVAKAVKRPLWLPNVPAFVMKAMLGEMSEIVLGGCKASSQKIEESGYVFDHPNLDQALKNLVS